MSLDRYLDVLRGRELSGVPSKLRARVMPEEWAWSRAGLDPHSCTTTVGALLYWLCGKQWYFSRAGVPDALQRPFAELPSTLTDDTLYVFHAAHHKFAVLAAGGASCLLHSSQDGFARGSRRFTLHEHLRSPTRFSAAELQSFLADLRGCPQNPEEVFGRWFGARWPRGDPASYWFAAVPLSMH